MKQKNPINPEEIQKKFLETYFEKFPENLTYGSLDPKIASITNLSIWKICLFIDVFQINMVGKSWLLGV